MSYLPAFQHLNALDELLVVDLAVPDELRQAYPQVKFVERDFRVFRSSLDHNKRTAGIVALPNRFHEEAVIRLLAAGVMSCVKSLWPFTRRPVCECEKRRWSSAFARC